MQGPSTLSPLSRWTVGIVFTVYLTLLLGVALFADTLARPWLGGLTIGQWLVLVLHIGPLVVAWYYIYAGTGLAEQSAEEAERS